MIRKEFDRLVEEKLEILDNSPERFTNEVIKAQVSLWNEIREEFEALETKGGKVVQSAKNLRTINSILKKMRVASSDGDYFKAVQSFLKEFDQTAKISERLTAVVNKSFNPNAFATQIKAAYRETAVQQLFANPVSNTETALRNSLVSSVAAGATLQQTLKSAREVIQGGPDTDGRMLANIKTVAATSIAVSDRGYTAVLNQQAGAEWYAYRGGKIETTRLFCRERNGKYFHRKEIEAWGRGEDAGDVEGIKEDGTWNGQKEGTTASTIFTFAGGWNCRHSIIMVPISYVPKDVINRNIANGNYKP